MDTSQALISNGSNGDEQKKIQYSPNSIQKSQHPNKDEDPHENAGLIPTSLSWTEDGSTSASSRPTAALLSSESTKKPVTITNDGPTTTTTTAAEDGIATDRTGAAEDENEGNYRVYAKRWFVLCVVSLLNCSNTMSWIAYAPVSNYVDCYYGGSTATWLSLVFLIAAIPVAFLAMWSVRRYGLRSAVLLAAYTNGAGALIRLVSSAIPTPASRYIVLLGQLSAAVAYPFIMFLPTKVAAAWFGQSQRATATMIAAMSNPLGVLFSNLISPQLVVQKSDVLYLNILLSIVPVVTVFLATFGVRTSDPPTPPGRSAAQKAMAFWPGIKKCMTSRAFLCLLLALGGGMGMFNALYTMMQQILCSRGYSNSFAGLCCILMIIGGLAGATASAKIVDITKRFEETMKVSFGIAVIGGVFFSLMALKPDLKIVIAICCTTFGFFGLAAYPIGLETGAECTYPVAETTSTGLIVLSGQIQGALYIILMGLLSKPLTNPAALDREVCSIGRQHSSSTGDCGPAEVVAKDMTVAMMIFASVATALALIFTLLFKPRLKRTTLEQTGKAVPSSKKPKNRVQGDDQNGGAKQVEMKVMTKGKLALTPDSPLVENA